MEPDTPAWNVYKESKHGNICLSKKGEWNFDNVPWVLGEDFSAPTCSVCHNSLLTNPDGEVLAERTHDFGSRLWVRLFSLIYSHPQPRKGDVTIIRNADGLSLPTTFAGEPATEYLIDEAIEKRWALQWLFYANSIKYSSAMTGAPDYATFKNGWWELSRNLEEMKEILDLKKSAK